EWGQLGQEVVQELDHELALVDAEAQVEEFEEPVADLGPLPSGGVMDVDDLDPIDDLPDTPSKTPGGKLPLFSELQQLPAQPRDDEELDADDPAGQETEPDVLNKDEYQGGGS